VPNADGPPNVSAEEDADFLDAILSSHMDPSMFFMKGMKEIRKAAEEPFYDESKGCTKDFMTLRSMLKLLIVKARYGLCDAGFDAFLSILTDPANTYYAKKLIGPLTMGVKKIHACRNHCILYQGDEYKDLDSYPNCGASSYKTNKDYREEDCATSVSTGNKRKKTQQKTQPTSKEKEEVEYYAQKKIPVLVMLYLPVDDRLRCFFTNAEDAQLMS
jgi:hypothetical protein